MGGYSLPSRTSREMIVGSVDRRVPARVCARLAQNHPHAPCVAMERRLITQDLFVYAIVGRTKGQPDRQFSRPNRPAEFWDRARDYGDDSGSRGARCVERLGGGGR